MQLVKTKIAKLSIIQWTPTNLATLGLGTSKSVLIRGMAQICTMINTLGHLNAEVVSFQGSSQIRVYP